MIRNMIIDDYKEVYKLWEEAEEVGINTHDDTSEKIDLFLHKNAELCFVAIEDVTIVGAILAGFDGRRGHIYHTVVKKEYRNQGIGKQLVSQVIHAFECLDVSEIDLLTLAGNEKGKEFWRKAGFFENERLKYHRRTIVK